LFTRPAGGEEGEDDDRKNKICFHTVKRSNAKCQKLGMTISE
jgi:hypothetical protein